MFSSEWRLALECQAIIAVVAVITATRMLRIPFRTALLAGLLFNSIPITRVPGYATPLFVHDCVVPLVAVLMLLGRPTRVGGIFWLAAIALFLWPAIGALVGVASGTQTSAWITFLYRRFGFWVFFGVGVGMIPRRLRAQDFLDTCMVIWIGTATLGMLQFLGLIDVDFLASDDALRGVSIAESTAAQKGFMGLNRGAVGVWGSAVIAYCASRLMLASRLGFARSAVYTTAVTLTAVVVLFSGSRTGAVACAAAGGYVGLKVVSQLRRARLARLVLFGAVGAIAGQQLLAPGLTAVSQRVGTLKSFGTLQALQSRLEVQGDTIRQVLRDGRSALLGMGADMALFKRLVGKLSHPHSEYILALWQTGVPGLLLYLLFLALLFSRMHARSRDDPDGVYLAGETMLVAGMVAGLAVGNILTVAGRLAPFGMTMLFVFGRLIRPTPSGDRPMQLPRAGYYSRYPY